MTEEQTKKLLDAVQALRDARIECMGAQKQLDLATKNMKAARDTFEKASHAVDDLLGSITAPKGPRRDAR